MCCCEFGVLCDCNVSLLVQRKLRPIPNVPVFGLVAAITDSDVASVILWQFRQVSLVSFGTTWTQKGSSAFALCGIWLTSIFSQASSLKLREFEPSDTV